MKWNKNEYHIALAMNLAREMADFISCIQLQAKIKDKS